MVKNKNKKIHKMISDLIADEKEAIKCYQKFLASKEFKKLDYKTRNDVQNQIEVYIKDELNHYSALCYINSVIID